MNEGQYTVYFSEIFLVKQVKHKVIDLPEYQLDTNFWQQKNFCENQPKTYRICFTILFKNQVLGGKIGKLVDDDPKC